MTELSEQEFNLFRRLIKKEVGISLRPAKRYMLGLKLAGRLQHLEIPSYISYYRFLLRPEGSGELHQFIDIVTINETGFFRNTFLFKLLQEKILPEIIKRNNSSKQIKIWSCGCSTGQEPYSIAILLEEIGITEPDWKPKILATDVNLLSLKTAFAGTYISHKMSGIPSTYLDKYFHKQRLGNDEYYTVKDNVKKKILFRRLNLIKSMHHISGPIDLILCRNVLIYLDQRTRLQTIDRFHRLLGPDRFLCLGGSESLPAFDSRFHSIGSGIYQKSR